MHLLFCIYTCICIYVYTCVYIYMCVCVIIIIIYSRVVVSQVTGTIVESTRTHTHTHERERTGRRSLIRPLKIHRHALYYCRRWRPSSFDKSVIIRRAHTHAKQTIIRPRARTRDFANHRVLTYVPIPRTRHTRVM
jgi:hypothetical protein